MSSISPQSKLSVGLSFLHYKDDQNQSIWSNGATQNTFFLYLLLKQSKRLGQVVLLNGGDSGVDDLPASLLPDKTSIEIMPLKEGIKTVDVLIEIGLKMSAEEIAQVRDRGGKAVACKVGNDYIMDVESIVFQNRKGPIFNGSQFDQVWSIPQHMRTCASYWEVASRCPVVEVPHIWNPLFFNHASSSLPQGAAYQRGRSKKRVAIFEPNLNVVKSCHYPMLVCEQLYRESPSLLESVYVLNTEHLKEHETFKAFSLNLDIVKNKLASFETRHIAPLFMATYADIAVAHQWENELNYFYYDMLYGGWPLVHNSEALKDYGYYYESFDASSGANALRRACTEHDRNLQEYNKKSLELLRKIDIKSPALVAEHERLIFSLFGVL
jgi:hypothetical protein